MARFFKPSRIVAIGLVAVAGLWIASGAFAPHAQEKKVEKTSVTPRQKVGVETITPQQRSRVVIISGVTQADRRASASTRAAGTVKELKVAKGSKVSAGDVVAILSDDGKEAAVRQGQALLDQRNADLNAQRVLIEKGTIARNQLNVLEANVAAAKAALATAQAELEKTKVTAPIDGVVDTVPVQLGQALQVGAQVAEVIGPDPMLAVGGVTEKDRAVVAVGQKVDLRFIDGRKASGTVSFVSLAGEKGTRTYRVEARIPNADAAIADGITCEIRLSLPAVEATPVPRSALVFSDKGELGIRYVDDAGAARFMAVSLVDDQQGTIWVKGPTGPTKLITVGQDFVKDGDPVEAAPAGKAGTKSEPPA